MSREQRYLITTSIRIFYRSIVDTIVSTSMIASVIWFTVLSQLPSVLEAFNPSIILSYRGKHDPSTTSFLKAHSENKDSEAICRSTFLKSILSTACAITVVPAVSRAETGEKLLNLSPDKIGSIVESDLVERSFLTNGALTRSIYSEAATFTDEIDTYKLDQWIKGTSRLFVGPPGSRVSLVGDVNASEREISFRFEEDLMFNIPFKPVVNLSGRVVLERDDNGLITSYREFWDQDVATVLKTAKF
jgi:hypothetical protein